MPELPEVETVRRSLQTQLPGLRIVSVTAEHDTASRDAVVPVMLRDEASGVGPATDSSHAQNDIVAFLMMRSQDRTLTGIRRRGKYLIVDLDDVSSLLVHLRMTGQLVVQEGSDPPVRFERLRFSLSDGRVLVFADQRRFGSIRPVVKDDLERLDRKLGPEPLSGAFTARSLQASIERRTGKIKSLLLNQGILAGLGNIYVDEALFLAGIHPHRSGGSLDQTEIRSLHRAIRKVLREATDRRGTTFSHFVDGEGLPGENQQYLKVYGRGRSGYPCDKCGHILDCIDTAGRSSHFCPNCQRLVVSSK